MKNLIASLFAISFITFSAISHADNSEYVNIECYALAYSAGHSSFSEGNDSHAVLMYNMSTEFLSRISRSADAMIKARELSNQYVNRQDEDKVMEGERFFQNICLSII